MVLTCINPIYTHRFFGAWKTTIVDCFFFKIEAGISMEFPIPMWCFPQKKSNQSIDRTFQVDMQAVPLMTRGSSIVWSLNWRRETETGETGKWWGDHEDVLGEYDFMVIFHAELWMLLLNGSYTWVSCLVCINTHWFTLMYLLGAPKNQWVKRNLQDDHHPRTGSHGFGTPIIEDHHPKSQAELKPAAKGGVWKSGAPKKWFSSWLQDISKSYERQWNHGAQKHPKNWGKNMSQTINGIAVVAIFDDGSS